VSPVAAAITRVTNKEFSSNTYICRTSTPGGCILIDPGLDQDAIQASLDESGLVPLAIFCTHGHFDHLGSAEQFRRKYAVPLHLHASDVRVARASNFLLMGLKYKTRIVVPDEYVFISEGFSWSTGTDHLEVVHVPGHTPGSTVLLFNGMAFTGDTLLRDNVWLGSLPGENREQLVASLSRLWDLLPNDTFIYPGHGGSTTFGEIKECNAPLRRMLGFTDVALV
jgi:hydroxyacylglutathione hydrolase